MGPSTLALPGRLASSAPPPPSRERRGRGDATHGSLRRVPVGDPPLPRARMCAPAAVFARPRCDTVGDGRDRPQHTHAPSSRQAAECLPKVKDRRYPPGPSAAVPRRQRASCQSRVCVCVCPRPRPPAPPFWAKSCVCVCVCLCECVFVWAVPGNRGVHPAHVRVKRRVRRYARCGATDGSAAACWGWPRVPIPTLCVCLRIRRDTSTTDSPPQPPLPRPALSAQVYVYNITPFAPPPFSEIGGGARQGCLIARQGRCRPLQR